MSFIAIAVTLLTQTPDPAFAKFLQACGAKMDRESSILKADIVRPRFAYRTKRPWATVKKSFPILQKGGWTLAPETEYSSLAATKGDQEIIFVESAKVTYAQRLPAQLRKLRDAREKLIMELDGFDSEFSTYLGEGAANEILFPAGSAKPLYFISGFYPDDSRGAKMKYPLKVTAYTLRAGKPAKLWSSDISVGTPTGDQSVLSAYFKERKWRLRSPAPLAAAIGGFAYSSENSGDGGVTVGFIEPSGRRWTTRTDWRSTITVDEEQFLKRGMK